MRNVFTSDGSRLYPSGAETSHARYVPGVKDAHSSPSSAPPAPVAEASVRENTDERADDAPASAPAAHSLIDAVRAHFAGPSHALEWAIEYTKVNGELPTGKQLAAAFNLSEGNCRKWVTPVRMALA